MGALEDTIRKVQQKYKNRPSPLSQQYIRSNANVNMVPQQITPTKDIRSNLLGNFRPPNDTFR
jgi:hypothetical protein